MKVSHSPNTHLRSLWPNITNSQFKSLSIAGATSPVNAPFSSKCMFCAPNKILVPSRAWSTVEIKGKATTFSGIALSNTDVNYDIKKQNIRWRYFSWYPRTYDDNENSILGSVKTDDKGEFTIKLDLEKDPNLDLNKYINFRDPDGNWIV